MIRVNDLSYVFDQRGIAGLHGISFNLPHGKVLGIMGPNGSGKSTLLNVLSGKIKPQRGSSKIDGKALFFPEESPLDPQQNVQRFLISSITLDIDDEKKNQLARDLADTFEFTFQLRQNLGQLSSGQQQKVLLASKLIDRPKVLLLDEPFTHLDPFTRRDILRDLFDYIRHQEMSVVWVTHDLQDGLHFSDEILILNFGRIEQKSIPIELIQQPKNLFVAQFVGYKNLFPVSFIDGAWMSPWGKLPFGLKENKEALLVVPHASWNIGPKGVEFKVLKRSPAQQSVEYELEYKNQKVYFSRSPGLPLFEENSSLTLAPIFEECLMIPL